MDYQKICISCMKTKGDLHVCPVCGFDELNYKSLPFGLKPRTVLNNRYVTGMVLGNGGFGITYIAFDMVLERVVAIKEYFVKSVMYRDGTSSSKVTTVSANVSEEQILQSNLRRFESEAKTLAGLEQLPGIVRVHDFFRENETVYMVLEYLPGQTLEEYIQLLGHPLPVQEVIRLLTPVMESLEKLHKRGILHRDISPDNMMLQNGGMDDAKVTLFDFGGAKQLIEGGKSSSIALKKMGYTPIEQIGYSSNQGPWTDVYAMAATIYFCICGKAPVDSTIRANNPEELVPPGKHGAKITRRQEAVLLKGMAVRSKDRYRSMAAFEADLLSESPYPVKHVGVLILAASLVLLGVGGWFVLNNTSLLKKNTIADDGSRENGRSVKELTDQSIADLQQKNDGKESGASENGTQEKGAQENIAQESDAEGVELDFFMIETEEKTEIGFSKSEMILPETEMVFESEQLTGTGEVETEIFTESEETETQILLPVEEEAEEKVEGGAETEIESETETGAETEKETETVILTEKEEILSEKTTEFREEEEAHTERLSEESGAEPWENEQEERIRETETEPAALKAMETDSREEPETEVVTEPEAQVHEEVNTAEAVTERVTEPVTEKVKEKRAERVTERLPERIIGKNVEEATEKTTERNIERTKEIVLDITAVAAAGASTAAEDETDFQSEKGASTGDEIELEFSLVKDVAVEKEETASPQEEEEELLSEPAETAVTEGYTEKNSVPQTDMVETLDMHLSGLTTEAEKENMEVKSTEEEILTEKEIVSETETEIEEAVETEQEIETEEETEPEQMTEADETEFTDASCGTYVVIAESLSLTVDEETITLTDENLPGPQKLELPKNTIVYVFYKENGNYYIRYAGRKGWVSEDTLACVSEKQDASMAEGSVCYVNTVPGEHAACYETPAETANVVYEAPYGEELVVEKIEGGYAKIKSEGKTGWIDVNKLQVYVEDSYYYVSAGSLNVREKPDTGSSATGSLYVGNTVKISEFSGGWGKTDNGWVAMKYMVPCKDADGGKQYETEAYVAPAYTPTYSWNSGSSGGNSGNSGGGSSRGRSSDGSTGKSNGTPKTTGF